jgi:hypothetical protein
MCVTGSLVVACKSAVCVVGIVVVVFGGIFGLITGFLVVSEVVGIVDCPVVVEGCVALTMSVVNGLTVGVAELSLVVLVNVVVFFVVVG